MTAELLSLHQSGMTYTQIARMKGLTKGTVAGRIRRYRATQSYKLKDLEHDMCRYPFGEKDYTFCGARVKSGSAYCEEHHAECHTGRVALDGKRKEERWNIEK